VIDARGFVACLALGAEGVLMGTRFLLTKECKLPDSYRKALMEAVETSTEIIQRSINNPSRVFRNKLVEEILAMEHKGTTLEELLPQVWEMDPVFDWANVSKVRDFWAASLLTAPK
jgi:nitronate monooxygenase